MAFVDKLTSVHEVKTITTYDFSTLYTSLPQDLLISATNSILKTPFSKKIKF